MRHHFCLAETLNHRETRKKTAHCIDVDPGPSRAGPGPRVGSKRGPPALKAPKNVLGYAIFLLDHALKFTGKTLLLGGHALLYTFGNTIFDEKSFLISV